MYSYVEFNNEAVKLVQEYYTENLSVRVVDVKKNGIVLDGLTILKKG